MTETILPSKMLQKRKTFISIPAHSHFPIQNLPFGVFQRQGASENGPRLGVALGDDVIDLHVLAKSGHFAPLGLGHNFFTTDCLNPLASLGPKTSSAIRNTLQDLFDASNQTLQKQPQLLADILVKQNLVTMHLPFKTSGFTDFYSSLHHASNVGSLFRDKNNPLLPNWKHLPVAYNGRASTLVVSGTQVRRPLGQISPGPGVPPIFAASRKLDFELEVGFFIGQENTHGSPIPVEEAESSIFGLVLVNDWSARDHQAWEYVPLGPFLAKSFATSISPWVVPYQVLQPFLVDLPTQDPTPLPYLQAKKHQSIPINLEVWLKPQGSTTSELITQTNLTELYWSMPQQLAHHTINGCKMCIGDLLATGTISGPTPKNLGSLLEMTLNGASPVHLGNGQTRTFLEDGDEVTLTGYCQGDGYRIGLGSVSGKIAPAHNSI